MLVRKAYKFKLCFHDGSGALPLYQFAGCCRFIWNTALVFQKERLDAGKYILPYEELTGKLVSWKKQYPFLKEVASQALQQRLKDLDKALRETFDPTNPKQFPSSRKSSKLRKRSGIHRVRGRKEICGRHLRLFSPKIVCIPPLAVL